MSFRAYIFYRTSSTDDRHQRLDPCFLEVDDSEPCIRHHLVSGEYQTIAADILYIDGKVWHGLRTIHKKECVITKFGFYLFDIVDLSGDIGYMTYRNYFHFITIFLIKIISIDLVFIGDSEKFYVEFFSLS